MAKILIVEDEKPIANLIDWNLSANGYECTWVGDGLQAADIIAAQTFDLILLDVMLPGISGFELIEQIKPTGTPVIFITAKGSVADRVQGLRAGADDYLVKPFEIVELQARVESVLRRAGKTQSVLTLGDVSLDTRSMSVTKGGVPVPLTVKEFELAQLFMQNKNVALFRDSIYERVWQQDFPADSRTLDLHVQRLRKKLGWQNCLHSVHKVGYRLEANE